jgi:hypothetical protein
MTPNLELEKTRDFGEIISDTFVFVRQNFKPLLSHFFVFCGFFLLAVMAFSILNQVKMMDIVTGERTYGAASDPFYIYRRMFSVNYFLLMLMIMLTYVSIIVTVYSFIALYKEKGNVAPTTSETWGYFKYHFFRILGSGIVIFVLMIAAFVLCIVPGIYLYPIMALIFPIMVIENATFSYAFGRSFDLIRKNWWTTFGCIFVMGIIVVVMSMVVVLPAAMVNMINIFMHFTKGGKISMAGTIVTVILQSLAYVFYMMPMITIALCYFSLTEGKEGTGLLNRIKKLGDNSAATNQPEGEY